MTAVTQTWHWRLTAAALSVALPSCASRTKTQPDHAQNEAHAMLAAARANQINMFGDIGDTADSRYFTLTAVSMRQHSFTEIGGDSDPDIDSTGQRLVFSSTRHHAAADLYFKSVDGVAVTQLTSDPASDIQPALSPDGSRVAFASNRSGNWDIWITSVTGDPPVQVTNGDADDVHPSWSPDGRQIVYCSLPRGGQVQWELWIADASAGESKRFIGYGLFPEWSPGGDTIVYQRARERGGHWFGIWTLTLVNGEPRSPTEIAASVAQAMILPTWSPDGRCIAFAATALPSVAERPTASADAGNDFDIWIMDADGRAKVRLTDGHTSNYAPTFSSDGRVYFTSNRSGHENIWSLSPSGGSVAEGEAVTFRAGASARPASAGSAVTVSVKDGL